MAVPASRCIYGLFTTTTHIGPDEAIYFNRPCICIKEAIHASTCTYAPFCERRTLCKHHSCSPRGHDTRVIPESRRSRAAAPRQERSKNIITRQECGPRLSPIACTRGRGHQTRAAAARGDETRVLCSKNIIVALIIRQKRAADYRRSPSIVCRVARAALTRPCASWV